MLSLGVLVVPVLPGCSKPGTERHELELCHMDGRPRLLHDLLRVLGTAQLCRTYRVCQE